MMSISLASPQLRANFRHLYADVFWFGVLSGSTMAFLVVYVARLGATGFQISLLTAGPALINLFVSLPVGIWLANRRTIPVTYWSAFLQRFGFLLLIPLPLLFTETSQIWWIVLITAIMSIPGAVLAISFNAMFAEVVPPDWRGELVGKRNALMAVSITATTLLCGQLLDRIDFPINYILVFGVGAIGAALSTYHLGRLKTPPPVGDADQKIHEPPERPDAGAHNNSRTRLNLRTVFPLDLLKGSFGTFLAVYLVFYTFQYLPLPLFPLVMVNELGLSDGVISIGSSLFYIVMLLVSLQLGKLSARYGHRQLLVTSSLVFGVYPLLMGLAQGNTLYFAASLVGGGVWAIMGASLINRLMEKAPEDQRAASMALHNLVLNLGILLGSLMGPVLVYYVGLQEAVLIAAGLRLIAGILIKIWG